MKLFCFISEALDFLDLNYYSLDYEIYIVIFSFASRYKSDINRDTSRYLADYALGLYPSYDKGVIEGKQPNIF